MPERDFDRVPSTSASALKSSMRCSARMFVIGNTTTMVLSAFSCSDGERKYGHRPFKMWMLGIVIIGGIHHGTFDRATNCRTNRVT